jgi:thiol:disulfide interchange protein DsbD
LRPIPQFALSPGQSQPQQHLAFEDIETLAQLDRVLAEAKGQGQPVMVDFTADWCVSCKEMEEYTFSNGGVATALASYRLLRADVTENDEDDAALMQRFGIFGPPTIAFFNREGIEHKGLRLVGFVPADDFIDHVGLADTL